MPLVTLLAVAGIGPVWSGHQVPDRRRLNDKTALLFGGYICRRLAAGHFVGDRFSINLGGVVLPCSGCAIACKANGQEKSDRY